jgi:hypothetical protein
MVEGDRFLRTRAFDGRDVRVRSTEVSSSRLYWENKLGFYDFKGVTVPTAVSNHFAAWQEPGLYTTEVRAGLRSMR